MNSSGCRERLQAEDLRLEVGVGGSLLKGCWPPAGEKLTLPSLGSSQPAEVGQVVSCPPDDFHHLVEEVDLQEATEAGACTGRKQAMQITKGLLQVLLYEQGGLEHPGLCPTHAGKLLHFLEGGMAVALLLHQGEGIGALKLLQGQLAEKFAQVVQSHNFAVEREARDR